MAFVEHAGPFFVGQKELSTWNQPTPTTKTVVLKSPSEQFSAHLSLHTDGELRIWFETSLTNGCAMAHCTCEFWENVCLRPLLLPNTDTDYPLNQKKTNWGYVRFIIQPKAKPTFPFVLCTPFPIILLH